MIRTAFQGRRAATIENESLRVTVLEEGGHIAEILHKQSGINPLWVPPWPSLEPGQYNPAMHPEYGAGAEAELLAGIMGHNLCLDVFGGPSPEEAAAGLTVHGEASVLAYQIAGSDAEMETTLSLSGAHLRFTRRISLHGASVRIRETVENLDGTDRPIAWTQHVTLGPPFLTKGATQFRASATRSKVYEKEFGADDYLTRGAEFAWPVAPPSVDLRVFTDAPRSSAFTTHLMDSAREHAFFVAFTPALDLAFGYVWRTADFPWLGIWEENLSRTQRPWSGQTIARGMEFGVSPVPESRREMIERGRLFGTPGYRWLPAKSRAEVEYWAVMRPAVSVPEDLEWPKG